MGTKVYFSIAFHPHATGQVERLNQILEDMLRAYVISLGTKWEDCLSFAEFSYNNSFPASRTPLNWSQTGEHQIMFSDMITKAEEI